MLIGLLPTWLSGKRLLLPMQKMKEKHVRSPGPGGPLEVEMAISPVFLPGKSHGQRSLADYGPAGGKESDTTERTHTHTPPFISHVISDSQLLQL